MSESIKGYVVILHGNTSAADAEPILNALRMVRGVLAVEPIVAEYKDRIAAYRAKKEVFSHIQQVCVKEIGLAWVPEKDNE